jgi:hypothetical protein
MPPGLLDSQFEALERIEPDENAIVLNLSAHKAPQEETDEIRRLGLLAEDRGSTSMRGGATLSASTRPRPRTLVLAGSRRPHCGHPPLVQLGEQCPELSVRIDLDRWAA